MKPFKMFFGLAIVLMLLFFVLRFVAIAFVLAAVMSIGYAVFRRVKDFVTNDRYGDPYFKGFENSRFINRMNHGPEPLFYEKSSTHNNVALTQTRLIEAI